MAETVVIGGGPAGLFAAETLAGAGCQVTVYEAMPSLGRKLLMAGRGGLNLTHSEAPERLRARYGAEADRLGPMLDRFGSDDLRAWAASLGIETFIGSSGRVFPRAMKASPLLRAWAGRLASLGVTIRLRHRWTGFTPEQGLVIQPPEGPPEVIHPRAAILALGGASWPRLGSDGAWVAPLAALGVAITPLGPANGGFTIDWSPGFAERWAGTPLKTIVLDDGAGAPLAGEAMVTAYGIEGGVFYAAGAGLRDRLGRDGAVTVHLDLKPGLSAQALAARLAQPRRGASFSNFLRKALGTPPIIAGLLRDVTGGPIPDDPMALALLVKHCPIRLNGLAPITRAISTSGGVAFASVNADLMLLARPGVFLAGEMLDWTAPTGGYLLQGCFCTGRHAAQGVLRWLDISPLAEADS